MASSICRSESLQVPYAKLGLVRHPYLKVVDFATFLANSLEFSPKLLAGFCYTAVAEWKRVFQDFWARYRTIDPSHEVFEKHGQRLSCCCPILLHGDEGTSYGRKGLFQYSWSPLLSAGASGLSRYFMISQLSYKFYAKLAKGNVKGKPALNAIMRAGCVSCLEAFEHGISCGEERIYLVTLGLCGDHVFHSRPGLYTHVGNSFLYSCMYIYTHIYASMYICVYISMCTYYICVYAL